jgi:hypothetical protein
VNRWRKKTNNREEQASVTKEAKVLTGHYGQGVSKYITFAANKLSLNKPRMKYPKYNESHGWRG